MNQYKEHISKSTGHTFLVVLILICTSVLTHAVIVLFNVAELNWDLEVHFAWSTQFSEAFWSGNLYPRWMPLGNSGLGEPVTMFYSPLFYYFISS